MKLTLAQVAERRGPRELFYKTKLYQSVSLLHFRDMKTQWELVPSWVVTTSTSGW